MGKASHAAELNLNFMPVGRAPLHGACCRSRLHIKRSNQVSDFARKQGKRFSIKRQLHSLYIGNIYHRFFFFDKIAQTLRLLHWNHIIKAIDIGTAHRVIFLWNTFLKCAADSNIAVRVMKQSFMQHHRLFI